MPDGRLHPRKTVGSAGGGNPVPRVGLYGSPGSRPIEKVFAPGERQTSWNTIF